LFRSPFFRRLFIPYLVLICLSIAAVGFFAALRLRDTYLQSRRAALHDQVLLMAPLVLDNLRADRIDELNQQVHALGQRLRCRVTVVASGGMVLADNWADPATMENHANRPEIIAAAHRGETFQTRHSDTVHDDMLYLAASVPGADGDNHFLRLAVRTSDLQRQLRLLYGGIGGLAVAAMFAAAAMCFFFARRNTEPIVELTEVARDISRGQLNRRSDPQQPGEMGALSGAINTMADSLQQLLAQTSKDKAELLTILASMSEGVIATDAQQNIRVANSAAAEMFDFESNAVQGKPLWQVIRVDQVIKAAEEVMATGERKQLEAGVVQGRHLEICLRPFGAGAAPAGLVLVAHDTTQSVRYQELRKEFVANVSHELRTPLTVIKGFVETLQDGAMTDPERSKQYLSTIGRHADQLTNLVSDLLELSKLESQPDLPRAVSVDLAALVRKTVDLILPAAQRKSQTIAVELKRLPLVVGNPDYLERAIANLIDNAIKYTPDGGQIRVSGRSSGTHLIVEVSDNGIGIPPEDIPRIFERFYRVDRSRSREMGGTGLGLSIVKHVAQVHGGTVEVTSNLGQGSTFRLKIPLPQHLDQITAWRSDDAA
jgi:two-component system phosphate regulon sensor histidine kinase PhoR